MAGQSPIRNSRVPCAEWSIMDSGDRIGSGHGNVDGGPLAFHWKFFARFAVGPSPAIRISFTNVIGNNMCSQPSFKIV